MLRKKKTLSKFIDQYVRDVAQYSSGGSLVSEPGWANAQSYSVTGHCPFFVVSLYKRS